MELPEKFLAEMNHLLGSEYEEYLHSFEHPSYYGIRVNTSKIDVEEFVRICPFELTPVPWVHNGFYVNKDANVTKHPYYYAGLYYVQEPSAMVPASRIPVECGDRILDLCAAPGGKATELGSRLRHSGYLLANDISNSRAKGLLKNLELFGIANMSVCSENPEKLAKVFPEYFDRILIDAPCSGEGMFRKDPAMLKSYQEHGPEYYVPIQREILKNAVSMCRPGGNILYSTCTFAKAENEENIKWLLQEFPEMHLADMPGYSGFTMGFEHDEFEQQLHLSKCVRLFPHKIHGEGHFAALLYKDADMVSEKKQKSQSGKKIPSEWEEFQQKYLRKEFGDYQMIQLKESLYAMPNNINIPSGIRFLRTGLYLGEVKKKRFEPSQALAMYLTPSDVKYAFSLNVDDERVIRYLKGETVELTSDEETKMKDGWVLVCVDGYALGWGKKVNGTIRNKYYAGWRLNG